MTIRTIRRENQSESTDILPLALWLNRFRRLFLPITLITLLAAIANARLFKFNEFLAIKTKPNNSSSGGNETTSVMTTATDVPTKVATAAKISNKTEMKIDSFFYVHIPKTGTSLYTVLRNRLESCRVKDFTCVGVWGGGLWGSMSKDGKDHYPYSKKSLGIGGMEVTCGNTLNCPPSGPSFHCQYSRPECREQRNKVTMFRHPQKWFRSLFEWLWVYEMTLKGSFDIEEMLQNFPPPMKFTTGKSDSSIKTNETTNMTILDEAFEILQSEYLWWGVTDYWHASVCIFHCELGGEARPSETKNSRTSTSSWMKNFTEFEATLPREKHLSALVPNYTAHVEEHFPDEIMFYHQKIMPEFRRRALACGCGNLLPPRQR
mmetsp:Transcript_64016/g.95009  ORF Transcript_64016/g.95009 Transcript_64016/m.95009 type:complete len:376 (+) Transcript_64016:29-1156(+)